MPKRIWRNLAVVIGFAALLLAVRSFLVPDDFGVGERGYIYGYHRLGNEAEWKSQPVRYRPPAAADCGGCHPQAEVLAASPHLEISCQNCHGPALDHPKEPPALTVDRNRSLCLRCHARLPYPQSGRGTVPGVASDGHHPGFPCVDCHDPHAAGRQEVQP